MRVFELDRWVLPLRGHLLIEDVFNIVDANGLMAQRPLHGLDQGVRTVVVFEGKQFFDAFGEGLLGAGQTFERGLGTLAQGEKGRHLLGVPGTAVVLVGHLAMLGEFDALFPQPAAGMGGHGLVLQVAGELVVVGFDGERFANEPGGHAISVAIEVDTKIGVHLGLGGIAAVGEELRQGAHGGWGKAFAGALPGGGMDSGIGDLIAPRVGLALEIGEITKRAQGPEVMPDVVDRSLFDFALFLGLPHVAGNGGDLEGP